MDILISHHTGALFSTLLAQIMELIARIKLSTAIQIAKEQAPTFQD